MVPIFQKIQKILKSSVEVPTIFLGFNYVESKPEEAKHWFVETPPRPLSETLIAKGLKLILSKNSSNHIKELLRNASDAPS